MPSLAKILERTMLATAAFGKNADFDLLGELKRDERLDAVPGSPKPPLFGGGVGIFDIINFPIHNIRELAVLQEKIKRARLWRWTYDSGQVQEVQNITCRTRSMHGKALAVCDKIVFRELRVKFFDKPEMVMPLLPKFELGRVFLDEGRIPARGSGLWQLRARTDPSFMNVLGYQLDAGDVWQPLPLDAVVDMGDDAMPQPPIVDHLKFKFTGNNVVTAKVARPRVIVVLRLGLLQGAQRLRAIRNSGSGADLSAGDGHGQREPRARRGDDRALAPHEEYACRAPSRRHGGGYRVDPLHGHE